MIDPKPVLLTLEVAGISTVILAVLCLPLSFWIVRGSSRLRWPVRLVVNLPLVLPPTVLGLCLLLLFSPGFPSGRILSAWGIAPLFRIESLVVGAVVVGIPYMCNPLLGGIESLSPSLAEASAVLGKGRLETFFRVLLPALRSSLLTGVTLAFSHACGEFGVVMMVGGKIPGETVTASLALYDAVEASDFGTAAAYAGVLLAVSCLVFVPTLIVGAKLRPGWAQGERP